MAPNMSSCAVQLVAIAAARNRARDAHLQLALADQPAEIDRTQHRPAAGMEEDRQLARPELRQEPAQALCDGEIDLAVGRDPFIAAGPTGIGVALGHVEHHGGQFRRLGFSRLGFRGPVFRGSGVGRFGDDRPRSDRLEERRAVHRLRQCRAAPNGDKSRQNHRQQAMPCHVTQPTSIPKIPWYQTGMPQCTQA
jgi:hypothetical protein